MAAANGVTCAAIPAHKPNDSPNVFQGENAAVADNDYLNYPQTIQSLVEHGFTSYRMSISWSRVVTFEVGVDGFPPKGHPNAAGIAHYHKVLQSLAKAGIEVALTMFHWDTPQALENYAHTNPNCKVQGAKTGSFWLCPDADQYFGEYSQILLEEYGHLVKYWITLNEPLTVIQNGYSGTAPHAPGRCSDRSVCWDGNDAIEPFVAAHNMLRAHATAFANHKREISKVDTNMTEGSVCGITLNGDYALPLTPSMKDRSASNRSMEYQMAIFMDPIYYGRWPESIVKGVGDKLPSLDPKIKGAHANIYFQNHYTTNFVWDQSDSTSQTKNLATGYFATANFSNSGYNPKTGDPIGLPSSNGWLFDYAPGIALIQSWLHDRYPGMAFIVTENGWGNASATQAQDMLDLDRCNFYRSYIGNMSTSAAKLGYDVLGYFAWSIMDNYEWADGFSTRFGLTYVDYQTQTRTPKLSLRWFKNVTGYTHLPRNGQAGLPRCEDFLPN